MRFPHSRVGKGAMNPYNMPIGELPNLGPKSAQWLREIGVETLVDLEAVGAIAAYQRLKALGLPVTLNLVWVIEATLLGLDWRDLPEADKDRLKKALGKV